MGDTQRDYYIGRRTDAAAVLLFSAWIHCKEAARCIKYPSNAGLYGCDCLQSYYLYRMIEIVKTLSVQKFQAQSTYII